VKEEFRAGWSHRGLLLASSVESKTPPSVPLEAGSRCKQCRKDVAKRQRRDLALYTTSSEVVTYVSASIRADEAPDRSRETDETRQPYVVPAPAITVCNQLPVN